ncbi:MAG: glycosyltransferase family 4 protein [Firmicutes bacterium]|nr:glycosyltransferase family 4 protein [Candidatus Fermentithermobacillaceae bacterium]
MTEPPMKVLMLAWEYPPDHVGGLGRHVRHISRALSDLGIEVTVLTRGEGNRTGWERDGDVRVFRVSAYSLHPPDFLTWAVELNVALLEAFIKEGRCEDFHLIHAHDWVVAYAARALKHALNCPLIATIHATEHGRHGGIHNPLQAHISETEWWLCYEAWKVICCSNYMKDEIRSLFGVPADKIEVISNGISSEWFTTPRQEGENPLILYAGRLVPEKGPETLVEAMPRVLEEFPTATLVLAGSGPLEPALRNRIFELGLGRAVSLAGHLDDVRLRDLYSRAWVACFPSSYEPFGIVALEAMASGTPVVVGDTGGLREIVEHGKDGLRVAPGDPSQLSSAIKALLRDRTWARDLAASARRKALEKYSWETVACRTLLVYGNVLGQRFGRESRVLRKLPARMPAGFLRAVLRPATSGEMKQEAAVPQSKEENSIRS